MDRTGGKLLQEQPSGSKSQYSPGPDDWNKLVRLLRHGEVEACEFLPVGSNVTCIARLGAGDGQCLAVYKPKRGETPLYDFPRGTLYLREYAAYSLSRMLGWPRVPPTVIREGPLGVGSFQLFVEANFEANYFTFASEKPDELREIALFDYVANNADRKGGHCLVDQSGAVWVIDHGLTFHYAPKLRTVIWDFAGRPIPERLLTDLAALLVEMQAGSERTDELDRLLSDLEVVALQRRIETALETRTFPLPGPGRHFPWPPV